MGLISLLVCSSPETCGMGTLKVKNTRNLPPLFQNQPVDTVFAKMQGMVYSNPERTRMIALDVLGFVSEHEMDDWKIRMLNLIGVTYALQSDLITAQKYYHEALALSIQTSNLLRKGDTYSNLGALNFLIRNYVDALDNQLEAIRSYELAGNHDKVAGSHCNIGVLYTELNNPEKSLKHFRQAYEGFTRVGDTYGLATVHNHMGMAFLKAGLKDSAMVHVDKAFALSEKDHNQYNLSFARTLKADIFREMKQYPDAIRYYEMGRSSSEMLNNRNLLCMVELGLSQLYEATGDIPAAMRAAKKTMYLADSLNDFKYLQEALEMISGLYYQSGDYKRSLEYYKKAGDIKVRLSDQSKINQIYNLEITRLSKEKEVQHLELERNRLLLGKRKSAIIIISLVSVMVVVTLVLLFSRIRHRQNVKMNEALLRHAEDRAKTAIDAEIQERMHLGTELHDGVGPMLSLAKLNLTALKEKQSLSAERKQTILQNTIQTINEILREIKNISHNMAPLVLMESGLEKAVRELAARLNETEKVTVSLDVSGLNGRLDSYLEHTVYRSILELVHNILVHAHGSEINLQIIRNHEDITVMVEDNGSGFSQEEAYTGQGLGLKSVRSRVEALNGKVYIDSMAGRGTIVTLVIPCSNNAASWKS